MIHQASSRSFIIYVILSLIPPALKLYPESAPFCFISLSLLLDFSHFSLPTMANNLLIKVQHRGANCPYSSMILSVQHAGSHPRDRGYYSQIGLSIKPTRPMNGSFNHFRYTREDKRLGKKKSHKHININNKLDKWDSKHLFTVGIEYCEKTGYIHCNKPHDKSTNTQFQHCPISCFKNWTPVIPL